ncbi:MAG: hypothetical protein HY699_08935 [Deltaproteobacteria bacterium]|nr:hypothetical protein [Deltaproteobacteria bacterium]
MIKIRHRNCEMEYLGGWSVWLLILIGNLGAAPRQRATTVTEICPGSFPDACEVSGPVLIASGAELDLAGRLLRLSPVASLDAENGGSFSIVQAAGITLEKGAEITAIGRGMDAGTLTITSTGPCLLAGKILASTARIGGVAGAGGSVSLTCNGISLGAAGAVEANGAGGRGGQITLDAGNGSLTSLKGARIRANGTGNRGGDLTIASTASCTVAATVQLSAFITNTVGGAGGSADIICNGITLAEGASIDANAAGYSADSSNAGGYIVLNAQSAPLVVERGVKLGANGVAAPGGAIEVSSLGTCLWSGKASVNSIANSGLAGNGGSFTVTCDSITVDRGGAEAIGGGPVGAGGAVTLFATGTSELLRIDKGVTLKATGVAVRGGTIALSSPGGCEVGARLQADGKEIYRSGQPPFGDGGGTVSLACAGYLNLLPGASISANASRSAAAGEITLTAGSDIYVAKGTGILASAKDGVGGHVSAVAGGNCWLAGTIESRGLGTAARGGEITLSCAGDLFLSRDGDLDAGAATTGITGFVAIQAGGGVQLEKGAQVENPGTSLAGANAIDVAAAGSCTIGGKFQSDSAGAPGAPIQISCGNITIENSALLQANGLGSDAGQVRLVASATAPASSCTIDGKIRVNASSTTDRSTTPPTVWRGRAGEVHVICGSDINVGESATIDAIGSGTDSAGGIIQLMAATGPAVLNGKLKARAVGSAGQISVTGVGIVTTGKSSLEVGGRTAGNVFLRSLFDGQAKGDVMIGKAVSARGSGSADNRGGVILVEACTVIVEPDGYLRSDGKLGGSNELTAHAKLWVKGKLSAVSSVATNPPGQNRLEYRDELVVEDQNGINPAPLRVVNPELQPCLPLP